MTLFLFLWWVATHQFRTHVVGNHVNLFMCLLHSHAKQRMGIVSIFFMCSYTNEWEGVKLSSPYMRHFSLC